MTKLSLRPPTPQRRSLMRSVRRKDTGPEILIRKELHAAGLRFRLNQGNLPGSPDIVLTKHAIVVFVHGCFWHGHRCKHGRVASATNTEFWIEKVQSNRRRDARKSRELKEKGWRVVVIWECEAKKGIGHLKVLAAIWSSSNAVAGFNKPAKRRTGTSVKLHRGSE
jgi:DNA mismatch endonuclease, patch repair protein